jgi:hypothetical protein
MFGGTLSAGIALFVLGIVLLFIVPWVGVPLGIVGLLLLIGYALGLGRGATRERA